MSAIIVKMAMVANSTTVVKRYLSAVSFRDLFMAVHSVVKITRLGNPLSAPLTVARTPLPNLFPDSAYSVELWD